MKKILNRFPIFSTVNTYIGYNNLCIVESQLVASFVPIRSHLTSPYKNQYVLRFIQNLKFI